MAGEPTIQIVGNVVADPELRTTQGNRRVTNLTVAVTPRTQQADKQWVDGETLWFRCSIWDDYADNVVKSLRKGQRVFVVGRLRQRSYDTQNGEHRTDLEIQVDEIGPVLRFATATVTRPDARGGQGQQPPQQQPVDRGGYRQQEEWAAGSQYPSDPTY